jgi:MoxR-like ATPase
MERISSEISKVIIGQQDVVRLFMVGILSNGHILLEGVPGLAKTLLAKTFSHIINVEFGRIQFTPDLMPADIIGTNIFDMNSRTFQLRKGPVFTNILLADEVNRTPPKTQAALLEAMEEKQISIDGVTYELPEDFMVIATQNPIEQEGTYPLPEAQLDRFLMKIILDYPEPEDEQQILSRYGKIVKDYGPEEMGVEKIRRKEWLTSIQKVMDKIEIEEGIISYVRQIVEHTRHSPHLYLGVSPRGGIFLLRTSLCLAAMNGREFITPDDVKQMALPVLRHRVILRPEAELEGLTPDRILSNIMEGIPVPR